MLLGCVVFLALGFLVVTVGRAPLMDFRTAYYAGQCLLKGSACDPYKESDIERLFSQEVPQPPLQGFAHLVVTRSIYLPSALPLALPFGLLPLHPAIYLWLSIIAVSFVLASLATWSVASNHAPFSSACLLFFCLANSMQLLNSGNPAGFVVPFCILAALSFVNDRFAPAGIVCFAIALAFKPHDGGLIWLYFLLAGGVYRKRALQTLAVVAAFSLSALFWISHISPHWTQELSGSFAALAGIGRMNDPRAIHGACMMTNLQTITSIFWSDPSSYNLASYIIWCPLVLIWIYITLRKRPTRSSAWFALASIAALSVLPVYHRQYDAKLIILAVPAFAILWARPGRMAWAALAVTSAAFFFNGDFPWVALLLGASKLHLFDPGPHQTLAVALSNFPVPFSLLVMGVFYLWVYARLVLKPDSGICGGEQDTAALSGLRGPVGDIGDGIQQ